MPSLFPTIPVRLGSVESASAPNAYFGRSWRFNFETGDFVLTPAGKVAGAEPIDAWLEWCRKALFTTRYQYLVYSRSYGQEFDDLIGRHLDRGANESEIRRMVRECLKTDPRTKDVTEFVFRWEGDTCYLTCKVTNAWGESSQLDHKVGAN